MQSTFALIGISSHLIISANAGLLAYYPFDSDFLDASGNANHLTVESGNPLISNTAGELVFGGGALNLAGNGESLDLTTPYNFSETDPWSVSFWARRRPGTDDPAGMVMGDRNTAASFIWNTANAGQVDGLRFRPASGGVGNGNNDYATGTDTDFHHWVVIADGTGQITVYRDKVSLGTSTANGGTIFDINAIGQGYNQTRLSFDGQLDEVHIFDEVIDEAKIEELFTGSQNDPKITAIRYLGTSLELDLEGLDRGTTYRIFRDVVLPSGEAKVQIGTDLSEVSSTTITDPGPLPADKAFYWIETP